MPNPVNYDEIEKLMELSQDTEFLILDFDETILDRFDNFVHPNVPEHLNAIANTPNVKIINLSTMTPLKGQKDRLKAKGFINDNIPHVLVGDFMNWYAFKNFKVSYDDLIATDNALKSYMDKKNENMKKNLSESDESIIESIPTINDTMKEKLKKINQLETYHQDIIVKMTKIDAAVGNKPKINNYINQNFNPNNKSILAFSDDDKDANIVIHNSTDHYDDYPLVMPVKLQDVGDQLVDYFAITRVLATYPKNSTVYSYVKQENNQILSKHLNAYDEFNRKKNEEWAKLKEIPYDSEEYQQQKNNCKDNFGDNKIKAIEHDYLNELTPLISACQWLLSDKYKLLNNIDIFYDKIDKLSNSKGGDKAKEKLIVAAQSMYNDIILLAKSESKPLDKQSIQELNSVLNESINTLDAVIQNKPNEVKVHAINLAKLTNTVSSRESHVRKALGFGLLTFGGLALVAAGIAAAAILAIPTFGASLAAAAGVFTAASTVGVVGAGVALKTSEAKGSAKIVNNFKEALHNIIPKEDEENKNESNDRPGM